jgi:hypothetical protein
LSAGVIEPPLRPMLRNLLGYHEVRVYFGSRAEWGQVPGTPIKKLIGFSRPPKDR